MNRQIFRRLKTERSNWQLLTWIINVIFRLWYFYYRELFFQYNLRTQPINIYPIINILIFLLISINIQSINIRSRNIGEK